MGYSETHARMSGSAEYPAHSSVMHSLACKTALNPKLLLSFVGLYNEALNCGTDQGFRIKIQDVGTSKKIKKSSNKKKKKQRCKVVRP